MNSKKNYEILHQLSCKASMLRGVSSLLEWDQETYMPTSGAEIRAEQLKLLAGLYHKERTSKKFTNALQRLIDIESGEIFAHDLNANQKAALREWRRDFLHDTALPTKFVQDYAQLSSQALLAWTESRKDNNFHHFAPYLDKLIFMNRKKADYLGYQDHPYDALLDLYEPEATTKEVDRLFATLETSICALLKIILAGQQVDSSLLKGNYDNDKQVEIGTKILKAIGYDFDKGRLDLSTHPFSSSCHPTDSRVTTRLLQENPISNIFVILHEGGHGMYEMGLPIKHFGSPLGEAISMGIHESQSRWWEALIGQSQGFWTYLLPLLQKAFKGKFDKIDRIALYHFVNRVKPSFIRVEADEITYPLHIILRFQLEKKLIEGSLNVRDIPDAWNHKMKELLGITPKTNAEGCLQDIHWSMGHMGYFPTYTLGNMYASQFFEAFTEQHPNWGGRIALGEFAFVKEWLTKNIYKHGRRYTAKELIKEVTGKDFSPQPYINYLTNKYSKIIDAL